MTCPATETALEIVRLPLPARVPSDWQALVNAPTVPERFGMGTCPMDRVPTIIQWANIAQDFATTKV